VPTEPKATSWSFPDPAGADSHDLIAVGGDLEPGTVLAAYRQGLFPMRADGLLGWWSPDPRGVIPLDGFHASRSLHRSRRRFTVTVNGAFADVIAACGDPARPHGWIDDEFVAAYSRLHDLGWVHSVEVWAGEELAGGLYGVRVGGLFAGESMFHRATDASKVALWATVELLRADDARLFDVQWTTPHLRSLGAVDVARTSYLQAVAAAVG
jgi:leucyl/phenylalanyl-tRNA--protein transferase